MGHSLADLTKRQPQPRRAVRYLAFLVADASPQRLEWNNLLGVTYWHRNEINKAIATFKSTVRMGPHSHEAIWAMKMLSHLYVKVGLRSERIAIDSQRLNLLRRLAHFANDEAELQFAYRELIKEYSDLGMLDIAEHYQAELRSVEETS